MFEWLKRRVGSSPVSTAADSTFDAVVRRSEQLYERTSDAGEVEMTVVVGPSGASSATFRGQAFWTMTCSVIGWRIAQLPVDSRRLTIRRRGQQEDLDTYRPQLAPYSVLRIRARLLDEPGSDPQALLEEVLGEEAGDTELTSLARKQQQPVVHVDGDLGTFELDRRLNWFSTSVNWGTSSVKVNLVADDRGQIANALEVARELCASQAAWTVKLGHFAALQLLDLKNESWRAANEAPLSADEFASKVRVESVVVEADGACEFCLHDGELFAGHSILVRGSVKDGLVDAEIAG